VEASQRPGVAAGGPGAGGVGYGWSGQDLAGRPKGDARKVRIAARLCQETTMTLAWISRRLQMGAPGHVSCLLYRTEPEAGDGKSENKLF
jgi:hypothetical protein